MFCSFITHDLDAKLPFISFLNANESWKRTYQQNRVSLGYVQDFRFDITETSHTHFLWAKLSFTSSTYDLQHVFIEVFLIKLCQI